MKKIITLVGLLSICFTAFAQSSEHLDSVDWEVPESDRSIKIYAEHNVAALEVLDIVAPDIQNGNVQFLNVETGNAFVCLTASNKISLTRIQTKLSKFKHKTSQGSPCR